MIIEKVTPQENYMLHVLADNNQSGYFDVSPYIDSEAFASLKEGENFKKIHNGKYYIEWECGADLSADTIEARWQKISA